MSRGPGKLQRQILTLLEQHPAFYERDLLGLAPSRSEQSALGRAIRELYDAGKIGIARCLGRNAAGARIVIFRIEKAECCMAHDQIERFMESLRKANVDPDVAAAAFKAMFEKKTLAPHPSEIARI
jgi:hypothetical protein